MFNQRNYTSSYGKTRPGDSGAFGIVIFVIILLALLAYSQT